MGYRTTFTGEITVDPPFKGEELEVLEEVSRWAYDGGNAPTFLAEWTKRNEIDVKLPEDSWGPAVALCYYDVNRLSTRDENYGHVIQCIAGDGGDIKAYGDPPWTEALFGKDGVFARNGRTFTGCVDATGEEDGDLWRVVGVGDHCIVEQATVTVTWPSEESA